MKVQNYFRICLFIPLIVPLPFLLLRGDEGLSALFIGSLVFGMPPYVMVFLLPFIYLFGRMTEKQIVIGIVFFPILYPLIFGLFWSIAPGFLNTSVKITLTNPSQWIFTAVVIPAAYSVVFLSGYIVRKLILKESDIHERIYAAVLCADVKDYGQYLKRDETGTMHMLDAYRGEFEKYVSEFMGRVVHMAGDSIVAKFTDVHNAIDCAITIQKHFKKKNTDLKSEESMLYRIGINLGDVVKKGKDIHGEGVDIAARIERISEPGGICISGSVYDHIKNKLAFNFEYLGEKGMTHIADPLRVYKITIDAPDIPAKESEVILSIPDRPSIAVLPFDNVSKFPEQEYFSNGLTGDILASLSSLDRLFVISRHSTFMYKNKSVPLKQIGKDLGVQFILQGSAGKEKERFYLNLELIDVVTGKCLWSDEFEEQWDKLFNIKNEVIKTVLGKLGIKLAEQEEERLYKEVTLNHEAHDLLMQGQEQYFNFTPKSIKDSITTFSQVSGLEPGYAIAYIWKSRVVIYQFIIGINNNIDETVLPAIALARKGLELDNSLPLGYACLGWALMWNSEIDEAITELNKAIGLDPNFAEGFMWYSMALSFAGKGSEALGIIEKAVRLNPFYNVQYIFAFGVAHFAQKEYAKALSYFERCNKRNPNYLPTHIFMTACHGLMGNKMESETSRRKLLQLDPDCIFTGISHFYIENIKQINEGLITAGVEPV